MDTMHGLEIGPILIVQEFQFGYKPKHGTELSIFVLKQVIEYHQAHSSPVYLCLMDLSKPFDYYAVICSMMCTLVFLYLYCLGE